VINKIEVETIKSKIIDNNCCTALKNCLIEGPSVAILLIKMKNLGGSFTLAINLKIVNEKILT